MPLQEWLRLKVDVTSISNDPTVPTKHAMSQLLDALPHNPEGRGFFSRCGHWEFSLSAVAGIAGSNFAWGMDVSFGCCVL